MKKYWAQSALMYFKEGDWTLGGAAQLNPSFELSLKQTSFFNAVNGRTD